jgi:quercetin dioxygenase-like cupin family protein
MKNIIATTLCTMLVMASATGRAQDYPHAYPREGAVEIFQNERVIVWEVIWADGVPQPYHQHRYDMTGVFLSWGPLKVTRLDDTFTLSEEPFDVPSVFLLNKGVTHKEESIGAPDRHAIMIDMKDVAGPSAVMRTDVPSFPGDHAEEMLDTQRVKVWDLQLEPGQELPKHVHPTDTVAIAFTGGAVRFHVEGREVMSTTLEEKDIGFYPAGTAHAVEVVSGAPRLMVYELKN